MSDMTSNAPEPFAATSNSAARDGTDDVSRPSIITGAPPNGVASHIVCDIFDPRSYAVMPCSMSRTRSINNTEAIAPQNSLLLHATKLKRPTALCGARVSMVATVLPTRCCTQKTAAQCNNNFGTGRIGMLEEERRYPNFNLCSKDLFVSRSFSSRTLLSSMPPASTTPSTGMSLLIVSAREGTVDDAREISTSGAPSYEDSIRHSV
mmetsp:Transcript_5407/g.11400  ORF Transcript_5407/g.11400 Transcript_5407/m.11400 type:complete len:207 (+) Transcript_5407:607-1227(+)